MIIINAVTARYGGQETVLNHFIHYASSSKETKFLFFVNEDFNFEKWKCYTNVTFVPLKINSFFSRVMWDLYGINKWVKTKNYSPSYALSLQNTGFYLKGIKKGVLMHNILPFEDINWSFFKTGELKFWVLKNIYSKYQKLFINKKMDIFVQTNYMGTVLKKHFPENLISIINHSFASIDISKRRLLNKKNQNLYFYPADDYLYKNHNMLVDAVSLIIKKKIDPNFSILFTLDKGSRVYQYVQEKGVEKYFIFSGKINHKEVLSKYRETTLIFPSEMESLGLPLVEAKSQGAEILAFAHPYVIETLSNYPKCTLMGYKRNDYNYNVEQIVKFLLDSYTERKSLLDFILK